ncbi:MAG: ATP-dependent DNA helicase [Desulfobacterales bacterium]|nr:ATP-dependent DNA helicase [Desulfobacterales bacterium]
MKRKLQVAVRALVEHVFRTGDLELEFTGAGRTLEAIRAHQKIQKSRPTGYTPEVAICREIETEYFFLCISGRIDGVYQTHESVMIDEIKTTTRDLDFFKTACNPLHWGQLKCYAYLYSLEHDLDKIDVQLTYYQLDTGDTLELREAFTREELDIFFQDLVDRYLEWAKTIADWVCLRDESIQVVEFPFAAYRNGQRQLAVDVYQTIKNQGQLIIQAATGIGKTMAVLFPAVKAMGEGLTSKIFYLTARTTGRITAEKALEDLRAKGLHLKHLTLTAKDKICFNPESTCNGQECKFAKGYFDRLSSALKDFFQQDGFTRQAIEEAARKHTLCPFEFSLELSLWADVVICDYNYAFDPQVYLRRFFQTENHDYIFLIDEAHNLVNRSREMFSAEIRKQSFLDLRRLVGRQLPQLYKSIGKINTWMVKAKKRMPEEENFLSEPIAPSEIYPLLWRFVKITEHQLVLNIKADYRPALLELYFAVNAFLRVAEQYNESYVTCFEKLDKDLKLKLFCIDPAAQMKNALARCEAAVFFSATLTPTNYFQQIFGCDASANKRIIPSPFPKENLCVLVADRISTYYNQREQTKTQVTQTIFNLVAQKPGNYLLFFPSYAYMQMIHAAFSENYPKIKTILQNSGMPEAQRDQFLEQFAEENTETLVGFAVMGGIFGEGIDLIGERLSGVIIVGVGLPGICPENELIRDYFTQSHQAGFEYAYLYPGINRVLQAAGRVIRTESDRGVVLLIDRRFATFRYKSLFPHQWHPMRVQNSNHLKNTLKTFWNR